MSDEFDWLSEDEADLVAATANIANGKRGHNDKSSGASSPNKRTKVNNQSESSSSLSTTLANKILKERFGLNGFRLEQEAAITRVLDGGSAVVVFPTGGGKSLCYQVSV
jgi:superfamily II DNA helicase RecQ